MPKTPGLIPIARASPIWGFFVFFGIHNWFLPIERRRSIGCAGWLFGPVFNIYSYLQYMKYEGIYWSPKSGTIMVQNVREVGSFEDVWAMIGAEGGLIQVSTIKGKDFGNVDTSGLFWTKATVEKGGSDSSTPAVIVAEGGGKIRARIQRLIADFDKQSQHTSFEKKAKEQAEFEDAVASFRKVPDP